ncbi:MAG TPA: F0F1 ATP synthase subunit A [Myxococcaceae bacterium]|nr:F0F1 ATP synthase subunit A [Myxococcaceae bacterium]
MRRIWGLVGVGALVAAGLAFAQEEHPAEAAPAAEAPGEHHEGAPAAEAGEHHAESAGGEAEPHDVGGFIMHHVSDSNEYELEVPLRPDLNRVIELPRIHLDLKAGACAAEHPSLMDGCLDLSITKHVMMMWIGSALLLLVALTLSHRNKKQLVPHGAMPNILEMLVLFVRDEIAIKTIGKEHGPKYVGYLLSAFFFILFLNLLGLIPEMATATGNIGVTLAMALCTFVITQYASIRAAGLGTYFKHLTGGVAPWLWPIMIPVEVLGLFTKPFALTMRLFANMVAGHIVIFFLLGLIFIMKSVALAAVSVPFAIGIYFLELFVSFLQAYIFTMLSGLFIGMGVAIAHHDDHGHGHEPEGKHGHDHGAAHEI